MFNLKNIIKRDNLSHANMSGYKKTNRKIFKGESPLDRITLSKMEACLFEFCEKCPKNDRCCSKVSKGGMIEPPFLTEEDIISSREIKGWAPEDFVDTRMLDNGDCAHFLRSGKEEGCIFLNKNGRCDIYKKRPIDCRLFPLDIIKKGNDFFWIMYKDFCPENSDIDIDGLVAYGERFLPKFLPYLEAFATVKFPLMDKARYTILKKIELCESVVG